MIGRELGKGKFTLGARQGQFHEHRSINNKHPDLTRNGAHGIGHLQNVFFLRYCLF